MLEHDTKQTSNFLKEWVTRDQVKEFFGYKNTKMSTFASEHNIRYSKIGNKIFYRIEDIKKLLIDNEETP